MPPIAKYEFRHAALSGQFGRDLAQKWFGRDLESLTKEFGVYRNGPRRGLCRGHVIWLKIHSGGWVRGDYPGDGCVLRPGTQIRALQSDLSIIQQPGSLRTMLRLAQTALS